MTATPTKPTEPRPLPDWPRLPRLVDPAPILPRHPGYADQVRAALVELGTTRDAITATLTALGITGSPRTPLDCPVFYYLLSLNLPVKDIDPMSAYLIDGSRVPLPDAVGEWIVAYDHPEVLTVPGWAVA